MAATEAEMALASRCLEAADAIESCGLELPEEFFDACEHDPTPETLSIIEDLSAAQCEEGTGDGKADGFRERAFVAACTPVLQAGYLTNRFRNPNGQRIPRADRDRLRPQFGSLVDRVTIHFDAKINTRWEIAGREVQYGNYRAQAYGSDIYITASYRPGDLRQLALIAHELQHNLQTEQAGSVRQSLANYCREFYRAGLSYRDNVLEVEARQVQAEVFDCLRSGAC